MLISRDEYRILDREGRVVTRACKSRLAQLINRGLVVGRINDAGALHSIRLADGVSPSKVKRAMTLRPARVSIANKAEVVKVLPMTWTHRSSLALGL